MHLPYAKRAGAAALIYSMVTLSGCASPHSRMDDMVGGALAGGLAGGATGTICCNNPTDSIPLGILIGAAAGAVIGFIWPTKY